MRWFCLLFLLLVGAAVAGFCVQNSQDVTLTFYHETLGVPIAAVVGIAYGLGMLTGWSVVGLLRRSFERATDFQREPAHAR